MKFLILLSLVASICGLTNHTGKIFCYYDLGRFIGEGLGKFLNQDLENALPYCTHLVYGYLEVNPDTYQVYSGALDLHKHQFSEVAVLKKRFPNLKVLLSIGGDKDIDSDHANKYIELLEGERVKQTAFINTAYSMVRSFGFDGIDLAFQFPKNKPRKVHSKAYLLWKTITKTFTGDFIVDPKADRHKKQFTTLVEEFTNALKPSGLLLTLTVLPNVNSTWYFDIPAVSKIVDYVNLAAFDFVTPERNPDEADYTAPLFELYGQNRLPHYNAEFQVSYWLQHSCPAHKVILGMATYGRAWKLTPDSGSTGVPVLAYTKGRAEPGMQSQTAGILSYPEVCDKFRSNPLLKGADAPFRRDGIYHGYYGAYAYRPADENGNHGIWVSYEDADSAWNKASYVRSNGLGGMSLFDLTYDDFRGNCTGEKYPLLKSVKNRL